VRGVPPDPGAHRGLRPLKAQPVADSGPPASLVLLRHGSTDDVEQQRVRGGVGAGPALNRAGRDQVRRSAELLAAWPGLSGLSASSVVLVSSPVLRARQSADLVAEKLSLPVELDIDWAEVALGDWDGLGYAEIAARWPAEYRAWLGSSSAAPPRGESMDDVAKRVAVARDRLIRNHPGRTAIVVTHTAPIRAVLASALDAGPAALWRLRIDPASVSVVRYWSDGGCEVGVVNSAAQPPSGGAP
jgi:ribonuclease H / adenosylcobalamin/alpha-ribazole phosphatase